MTPVNAVVRNGKSQIAAPIEFTDGTEVRVWLDVAAHDEGPMSSDEIERTLAAMDQVQPLEITDEEHQQWQAVFSYGAIAAELRKIGCPMKTIDMMLAAVASNLANCTGYHDVTLVDCGPLKLKAVTDAMVNKVRTLFEKSWRVAPSRIRAPRTVVPSNAGSCPSHKLGPECRSWR